MTIEQLYCFIEVYHYKSITRAAKNLGISRQAVSNTIKKLEVELNIPLFERSSSGTIPTKVGENLYGHAIVIIKEIAAIKQNINRSDLDRETFKICKIGLAESLLLVFGEELFEALTMTFPNIYFDVSAFTFQYDNKDEYRNYDISVPVLFDSQHQCMFGRQIDNDYRVVELEKIPVYVWIAEDSIYNQYETLNFKILRNAICCTLKNSYNSNNLLKMLEKDNACCLNRIEEIYLKSNFIDCIEKFGYFTVDFPVINNKFFYTDILQGHRVKLKRTEYFLYKSIVYNKITCENIYQVVISILV